MQGERSLLEQAREMLRDFARSAHREQFPHVKPDSREAKADSLIAAIDAHRGKAGGGNE